MKTFERRSSPAVLSISNSGSTPPLSLAVKRVLLPLACGFGSFYSVSGYTSELSALINHTIDSNYQIISARYDVNSSRYDKDISSAFFYPSINASANTTWNESDVDSTTPSNNEYNSNGYRISITQTILDLSRLDTYKESEIDLKISRLQHDKVVNDIVFEVVDNYFSYLKYHAQKKATDAQLKSSQSRLKQITRNHELGNLPKTDVYETQAQKGTTSKQITDIRKKISQALNQLRSTTQTRISPSYDMALTNQYSQIDESEKAALEKKLISGNFEIAIARSKLDRSKRTLSKSKSEFYPTLSASANYEYSDSNLDHSIQDTSTYALTLDVPIFEGGSDYYEYQKSKNTIQQLSSRYDQSLNDTRVELDDTILNINANIESLDILKSVIKSNYLVYTGNKKAYRLGTKTLTDLLNSESDLYDSIRDYHSNQYDYIINTTKLYSLFGAIDLKAIEAISNSMVPINETFDMAALEQFASGEMPNE